MEGIRSRILFYCQISEGRAIGTQLFENTFTRDGVISCPPSGYCRFTIESLVSSRSLEAAKWRNKAAFRVLLETAVRELTLPAAARARSLHSSLVDHHWHRGESGSPRCRLFRKWPFRAEGKYVYVPFRARYFVRFCLILEGEGVFVGFFIGCIMDSVNDE